jgi:hypothetical protein
VRHLHDLDELLLRLRALGFLCHVETYEGLSKVAIGKLPSTPGNRLMGYRGPWMMDDPMGDDLPEADGPSPNINVTRDGITFGFGIRVPGPPNYWRELSSIDELYEELLHYWFDADSPMATEEGFIPGPCRPSGA